MLLILLLSQFPIADSLFIHGHYDLARIEYMREFYFVPEYYRNEGKRLAFSLATLHIDTLAGLYELDRLTTDMPDMSDSTRITIAEYYISLNRTHKARQLLEHTSENRLYGFTYIIEQDLVSAHDYFSAINDSTMLYEISLYNNQPKRSLHTATLLSLICPGAGEIYAGNVPLGIKDFLLNAGSVYLFYNAVRHKNYVDAVLVFNLLFHRFYIGSIYNAQKTVFESKERVYSEWQEYMKHTYFQEIETR